MEENIEDQSYLSKKRKRKKNAKHQSVREINKGRKSTNEQGGGGTMTTATEERAREERDEKGNRRNDDVTGRKTKERGICACFACRN